VSPQGSPVVKNLVILRRVRAVEWPQARACACAIMCCSEPFPVEKARSSSSWNWRPL